MNNPASAFFFNSNSRINSLVNDITIRTIGDIADCVTGFYSGNDKIYLRPANPKIKNAKKYQPILSHEIHHGELTEKEKDLIEAIRNYRKSLGIMENRFDFEWYIYKVLHELMGN